MNLTCYQYHSHFFRREIALFISRKLILSSINWHNSQVLYQKITDSFFQCLIMKNTRYDPSNSVLVSGDWKQGNCRRSKSKEMLGCYLVFFMCWTRIGKYTIEFDAICTDTNAIDNGKIWWLDINEKMNESNNNIDNADVLTNESLLV